VWSPWPGGVKIFTMFRFNRSMRALYLTNQVFGDLTVVSRAPSGTGA
jgi:hypothetical protein